MAWIHESESAKCIADLKTSNSITEAKLQRTFRGAWMICEYFQCQRHRRISLGLQRDFEGRIGEELRTIVQHAMGWNHNRGEEATRRGTSGEFILPSASTVTAAEVITVCVNSRYC